MTIKFLYISPTTKVWQQDARIFLKSSKLEELPRILSMLNLEPLAAIESDTIELKERQNDREERN